ncbi:NAD-dependent epimerase/dehydratase family protein [Negadavirga shengliensis]|uniref:NAD-dependent epimerase/dehydratase family protein n=1 Tax=Negadavirga shengliensis TaxID=1389218 RepID=A0ABV9T4S5_9BACT
MDKILVTGAGGQLGTELTQALADKHGAENVWATDINPEMREKFEYCHFRTLDVLDGEAVRKLIENEAITQVYHLAAVLSASGENNPLFAWRLNMESLLSLLELAKSIKLDRIFWPSSIAVFGPNAPKTHTSQFAVKEPTTVYGISKLAGERWCEYYHKKHRVDVRSLRYPGLVGYKSLPGGGTTDYAVDIYHKAINNQNFGCFLKPDTRLPMMYMPDAIKATLRLMDSPSENIKIRSSYNLAAISFTPEEIYESIKAHLPDFSIEYKPDYRQQIAEGWPQCIDDSAARKDWGWHHDYDLEDMTQDILANLPEYIPYLHKQQ